MGDFCWEMEEEVLVEKEGSVDGTGEAANRDAAEDSEERDNDVKG